MDQATHPRTMFEKIWDAHVVREVEGQGTLLYIDLSQQLVTTPSGQTIAFEIEPFKKHGLVQGLDAIERTLQLQEDITAFEARRKATAPWYDVESTIQG